MGLDIYLTCKILCPKCGHVIDFVDENVYDISNDWKESEYSENLFHITCAKCKTRIARLEVSA